MHNFHYPLVYVFTVEVKLKEATRIGLENCLFVGNGILINNLVLSREAEIVGRGILFTHQCPKLEAELDGFPRYFLPRKNCTRRY